MSLLLPLGLLGLIGIAVLILIYLLKPNYQQKFVSSTYVWKLSLKYRKKRIPISKLRNILILLCQVLIITACALLIAQPVILQNRESERNEKIAVIDASAGMLASYDGTTRFERAVSRVSSLAEEVRGNNGRITVILASDEPYAITQRAGADAIDDLKIALDELVDPFSFQCTYGKADVDGAMEIANKVLEENPQAEIIYYTGTKYSNTSDVTVESVAVEGEWNTAILSATAEIVEGSYRFIVEVGSYGLDTPPTSEITCELAGCNGKDERITLSRGVFIMDGETDTVVFDVSDELQMSLWEFETAHFSFDTDDSFGADNDLYLYGGVKPTIKIQYVTTQKNNMTPAALFAIRERKDSPWNIEIKEISSGSYALEGYDFYIFEHTVPRKLPTDGAVLFFDPPTSVAGANFDVLGQYQAPTGSAYFFEYGDAAGSIMNAVNPANIAATVYTKIVLEDAGYNTAMSCNGDPVFAYMNDRYSKIAILPFSVHYSTVGAQAPYPYLPVIFVNLFDEFFPRTLSSNLFEVNDKLTLNMRGTGMRYDAPDSDGEVELTAIPYETVLRAPGTYTLHQTLLSEETCTEQFYVKVPATESNINREEDVLTTVVFQQQTLIEDTDLLIYFASVLVAILFIEWWLQSREHF